MEIVFSEESKNDLINIFEYYFEIGGKYLKDKIENKIFKQISDIVFFPKKYKLSEKIENCYEMKVTNLPFLVFYEIEDEKIVILSIVHTSRKFPN